MPGLLLNSVDGIIAWAVAPTMHNFSSLLATGSTYWDLLVRESEASGKH